MNSTPVHIASYARWFFPLLLVIVVVATTALVVDHIVRPQNVVVRFMNGPTVLSTQVVPLR